MTDLPARSSTYPRNPLRLAARLHAIFGVLLGAYASFHLYVQYGTISGRDLWYERMRDYGLGSVLGGLVIVTLVGHALVGVWRFFEDRRRPRDPRQVLQLIAGGLLLVFLFAHLASVWPRPSGPEAGVLTSYGVLWSELGRPAVLVLYVVGVTSLAFHLTLGLQRLGQRASAEPGPEVRSRRSISYLAFALGVALWLGYLQVVAHYAIGQSLLPTGGPLPSANDPLEDDGASPGR